MTKTCFKCGSLKPLTDFYRHPQMPDGHVNKCKDCNKVDVRANYALRRDYYNAFDRARNVKPERKAAHNKSARTRNRDPERRQQKNERERLRCQEPVVRAKRREWLRQFRVSCPEKNRAHWLVSEALRKGVLVKKPCGTCGKKAQAHHPDYSKPLDVKWLCSQHHSDEHHGQI